MTTRRSTSTPIDDTNPSAIRHQPVRDHGSMTTAGLLLAAGAGRRMGLPKALVRDGDGEPWIASAVRALREGGCDQVLVVLGAAAEEARSLFDAPSIVAEDWRIGMGASLRAGLTALGEHDGDDDGVDAAMVHLVDLPDVGPDVIRRLLTAVVPTRSTLARAAYGRGPGHPVLIGRDHWPGVMAQAEGDQGARGYLATHRVIEVDCSDLAGGVDVDACGPPEL